MTVSEAASNAPLVAKAVKGKGTIMVPEGIDPGFAYHPGKAGLVTPP